MNDVSSTALDNAIKSEEQETQASQQAAWTRNLPYILGGVALTVYILLVIYLINKVSDEGINDATWMRMLYLFTGVESIAFAAAGFVFGREVNRGRAEAAEQQASRESKRAATAQAEKARLETAGKALTMKIRHLAEDQPNTGGKPALEFSPAANPLKMLVREAEQLFP